MCNIRQNLVIYRACVRLCRGHKCRTASEIICAAVFCLQCLFYIMSGYAYYLIRSEIFSCGFYVKVVLPQMNAVCVDLLCQLYVIVDNKRNIVLLAYRLQLKGDFSEMLVFSVLFTKLEYCNSALYRLLCL